MAYTDKHSGIAYTQGQIDRNLRKAKAELIQIQLDAFGYNFCQECSLNSSNSRIDCSHNKSIQECKNDGDIELIWAIKNMELICRKCHQKKDGLNLQFGS